MTDTVYQTNKFEVVSLNDPSLGDVLEEWGIPSALDSVPADSLSQMREVNAFVILNKSSGGVGVIDAVTLATSYEEVHPSELRVTVKKNFTEKVMERAAALQELDESEDFYRGASAFLDVLTEIRNETAMGAANGSV